MELQIASRAVNRILTIALLLCILMLSSVAGENFNYKVKYGLIQAGSASLRMEAVGDTLHGSLIIHASPWLSRLWTLSDSIHSEYDLKNSLLVSHDKAIHEGNYHRKYEVSFEDSIVVNGVSRFENIPGLLDVPSLLHKLMSQKFVHGEILKFQLWDGRSFGDLVLRVDRIRDAKFRNPFIQSGWQLTPLSSSEKSREHNVRLELLYSEGEPHLPERIQISTKYGDVLMKLGDD